MSVAEMFQVIKTIYNRRQTFWDIVVRWGNFKEQTNPFPHLPPTLPLRTIQSWCVFFCFFVFYRYCIEGVGEGKLYFPLFKITTRQKGPIEERFSRNFVADCKLVKRHDVFNNSISFFAIFIFTCINRCGSMSPESLS